MQIKNIRHIGIPTSDMEAALLFWEAAGFAVDTSGSDVINGRKINWVKMKNDQGYCIEVLDGGSFHIAFTVDQVIPEHYISLAPSGHRIQFGQGPDGIGLEFVEGPLEVNPADAYKFERIHMESTMNQERKKHEIR